jgi:hypothetical protein
MQPQMLKFRGVWRAGACHHAGDISRVAGSVRRMQARAFDRQLDASPD